MRLSRSVAIPAVVWLCVAGCAATVVQMRLAPDLHGVAPLSVQDRQMYAWSKSVKFGSWQVTTASAPESHLRSMSIANPSKEVSKDRVRLAFELQVSADDSSARLSTTRVDCQALGRAAKLTRFAGRLADETEIATPGFPRIDCEFSGAVAGALKSRPVSVTQREHGTAQFGESAWQIQSVNQMSNQRGDLPLARFGYVGLLDGSVVAAVETVGPGRVWILPGLGRQQQDEWAAVASALLYYVTALEMHGH
jgi:hypothetical protein